MSLSQAGSGIQLATIRILVGVHLLTVFMSQALPLLLAIGGHSHSMASSSFPEALEAYLTPPVLTAANVAGCVGSGAMIAGLLTPLAVSTTLLAFLVTQNYWFRTTVFHDDWLYFVFPLVILALCRCSDRLALDSLLRKTVPARGDARQCYRWPVELIVAWFAFVYVSGGIAKLFPLRKGVLWLSGRSVQQFAFEFMPDSPIFWLTGRSLFDYRLLWPFCLASWATLLIELSAGVMLVAPRARLLLWALVTSMHIGIWALGLPGFVQIALVFAIAMVPPESFGDAAPRES